MRAEALSEKNLAVTSEIEDFFKFVVRDLCIYCDQLGLFSYICEGTIYN